MLEQLRWLGKKSELELDSKKFKGKLAGKAWKFSQNIDSLIRIRLIIFALSIAVLIPLVLAYFAGEFIPKEVVYERLVMTVLLIASGLVFNKSRVLALIIALLPTLLILYSYIFLSEVFNLRVVGFYGACIVFLLTGFYHLYRIGQLKKELEASLLENQIHQE